MYKMLANLYGDVPIVLEEVTSPRRDFVRSSREEVYQQSAADLLLAAQELPDVDDVDNSRINKLAAYHLLSEVYISLGRWQEAVDAASQVIDHPQTALMTEDLDQWWIILHLEGMFTGTYSDKETKTECPAIQRPYGYCNTNLMSRGE